MQFDVAISAPTNGETIEVQSIGQSGPSVNGSITYRVNWTCSESPAPVQITWNLYWNDMSAASDVIDVTWTGNSGEAIASPSFFPYYSGINSGPNYYKLTATDGINDREAAVECTIVAM